MITDYFFSPQKTQINCKKSNKYYKNVNSYIQINIYVFVSFNQKVE